MHRESPRRAGEPRMFPLASILSVTTGRLLCDIGGVYELLGYMTDDEPFTHQLPRFARECGPALLRQHPKLACVDVENCGPDNWLDWLMEKQARFGTELPVAPVTGHVRKDPVAELAEMVGPERVIVVEVPHDTP